MFQLIQRKGSSRHQMALINLDGSVSRAWPVNLVSGNGNPVLGSGLENRNAEPVNLQFGHFGISAWHSDGGTSRAGSVAGSIGDSRMDWTDTAGANTNRFVVARLGFLMGLPRSRRTSFRCMVVMRRLMTCLLKAMTI